MREKFKFTLSEGKRVRENPLLQVSITPRRARFFVTTRKSDFSAEKKNQNKNQLTRELRAHTAISQLVVLFTAVSRTERNIARNSRSTTRREKAHRDTQTASTQLSGTHTGGDFPTESKLF